MYRCIKHILFLIAVSVNVMNNLSAMEIASLQFIDSDTAFKADSDGSGDLIPDYKK